MRKRNVFLNEFPERIAMDYDVIDSNLICDLVNTSGTQVVL
jgi:hypothetical protein